MNIFKNTTGRNGSMMPSPNEGSCPLFLSLTVSGSILCYFLLSDRELILQRYLRRDSPNESFTARNPPEVGAARMLRGSLAGRRGSAPGRDGSYRVARRGSDPRQPILPRMESAADLPLVMSASRMLSAAFRIVSARPSPDAIQDDRTPRSL